MDRFVRIISVRAATDETTYVATVVLADAKDVETVVDYVSRESDPYGLAPQVRAAILQWIADGKPVEPYVAPPPVFPDLTSRQVRLGLLSIGITEGAVEAALEDDPEAITEWRYATSIERQHPLVSSLGNYFDLPDEQIDTLWLWASGL